jgi:hypothetical protein
MRHRNAIGKRAAGHDCSIEWVAPVGWRSWHDGEANWLAGSIGAVKFTDRSLSILMSLVRHEGKTF